MKTNNLGLPLEYQQVPEYFDAHNINEETATKNGIIEQLLREQKVHTVLDLTCGTGSQVFFLTQRGYQVTGADFSPALLEQARERARNENMNVCFIDGDMRTLHVGKFDAVITIFNAIGHLTKPDFEIALKNIHDNLNPGGVYVFDILNLNAITDAVIPKFAMQTHRMINGTNVYQTQCSTVDRELGLLTSYDYYITQKGAEAPQRLSNQFSLQIYTAQELRKMLARNGFKTIGQYGMDGSAFVDETTPNILMVAKRK
jgi:ubiquinone/menaquinone biosynthesis C-methylase UbiE